MVICENGGRIINDGTFKSQGISKRLTKIQNGLQRRSDYLILIKQYARYQNYKKI